MRVDDQMYQLAVSVMEQVEKTCPKHGQHVKPKCDCGAFQTPAYRLASVVWGAAIFGRNDNQTPARSIP